MPKGFCKFFKEGKCTCRAMVYGCEYRYPEFDTCEDYEEQED